ncbi:hypothetical protein, partial [Corynebacterium striatum]|uniref:hypothetical protein n=1 Tax=Corynebacterium striatum TaxID=43770 RepID=UPI001955F42C
VTADIKQQTTTTYTRRSTTHHKGNAPSFRLSGGPVPDYNVRDQPSFDRYAVVDHKGCPECDPQVRGVTYGALV